MNVDDDLVGALLDVRKAYRLLYSYHKRIFAMAEGINDNLEGFSFMSGESGYDLLKKWRPQDDEVEYWETLPFYSTVFKWARCRDELHLARKTKHLNLSDRFLAIEVLADVVVEDAEDRDPDTCGQRAEQSKTIIRCFFGRPLKECDGISIMDAWDVDVTRSQFVTRSKKGEFVLFRDDFDLATMPAKTDVIRAVTDFISNAELTLDSA